MAVRLRLMRMGKKKQPTYRVVAADSRKARNGRFIENIGTYNPRQEPSLVEIDNERALHWLRHGAQPSERVQKLLVISGAWAEFTGVAGPVQEADKRPAIVTTAASAETGAPAAEDAAQEAGEDAEAAEDRPKPPRTPRKPQPARMPKPPGKPQMLKKPKTPLRTPAKLRSRTPRKPRAMNRERHRLGS